MLILNSGHLGLIVLVELLVSVLVLTSDELISLISNSRDVGIGVGNGGILGSGGGFVVPSGSVLDDLIVNHLVLGLVHGISGSLISVNGSLMGSLSRSVSGTIVIVSSIESGLLGSSIG